MSINKVILIGRVGKDPDIKTFDNGGQVAQFSLATTSKWKTKEGEKKERTEWHNLVINGKLSEVAEKYIRKGMQLYIEGEIRYREYEKEGVKKYMTEIFCNVFQMLDSKESGQRANTIELPEVTIGAIFTNSPVEDDLPF